VLRQIWLEHGDKSPEWRENTLVIDNLLWSIRPKVELDERKQLASVLPRMLQTLSLGMQRIALPEAGRAEFLDTCFVLQTAAMRGATAPAPAASESPETLATPQAASVVPVSSELRIGTQLLRISTLPARG